jgi:hypothetical protein
MSNSTKGNILKIAAILIDVGAPLAATLTQFPVWIDRSSEATISGVFVLLAFLSCLPFIKAIKAFLKSPSVWVIWLLMFISLYALESIINEMIIVAFVGLVANCIGAAIYKIGRRLTKK